MLKTTISLNTALLLLASSMSIATSVGKIPVGDVNNIINAEKYFTVYFDLEIMPFKYGRGVGNCRTGKPLVTMEYHTNISPKTRSIQKGERFEIIDSSFQRDDFRFTHRYIVVGKRPSDGTTIVLTISPRNLMDSISIAEFNAGCLGSVQIVVTEHDSSKGPDDL